MPDLTELAVRRSCELLTPLLPPVPARLLEVGCGRGALAAELGRRGWSVTGLDVDAEACAAARQRGVEVVHGSLTELPTGAFDAVLFTRSLHHVTDLAGTLRAAAAVVQPGGRLVLEEFARERADAAATAFLYDTIDLLHAAGIADPADDPADYQGGRPTDPALRWQRQRGDGADHPLHSGTTILAELGTYGPVERRDCETLWRLILSRITAADGAAIGRQLYDIERRRIDDGTLPAVGFVAAATPS